MGNALLPDDLQDHQRTPQVRQEESVPLMNSRTRRSIQEIRKRVQIPITPQNQYQDDDQMLEQAIRQYYACLRKEKNL